MKVVDCLSVEEGSSPFRVLCFACGYAWRSDAELEVMFVGCSCKRSRSDFGGSGARWNGGRS